MEAKILVIERGEYCNIIKMRLKEMIGLSSPADWAVRVR